MKRKIQFLIMSVLMISMFFSSFGVKASNSKGTAKNVPFSKSVKGNVGLYDNVYYSFEVKEAGTITLSAQTFDNMLIALEMFSEDSSEKVNTINLLTEQKSIQLYVQPQKYYIKLSTSHLNAEFQMKLKFKKGNIKKEHKDNLSFEKALVLKDKNKYYDIMGFNQSEKYYSIKVEKNKGLNLKIKGYDQIATTVIIYDSKKNEVLKDWFYGGGKSSIINEPVKAGTYYCVINTSNDNYSNGRYYSIETDGYTEIEKITVAASKKTIGVGEKYNLNTKVTPNNATEKYTYSSSNKKIATVSSKGVVTGIKKGTATITVQSEDTKKKVTCKITVKEIKPTKITISEKAKTLDIKGTFVLNATVSPSNATKKTVSWKSSNTKVATVDKKGTVVAVGSGTATITATNDKLTAQCVVTVKAAPVVTPKPTPKPTPTPTPKPTEAPKPTATPTPKEIKVEKITMPRSAKKIVGESITLNVLITPNNATNKTLSWSSSNTDVATVNNGVVVCKGKGSATITVTTANGLTAHCSITVTE